MVWAYFGAKKMKDSLTDPYSPQQPGRLGMVVVVHPSGSTTFRYRYTIEKVASMLMLTMLHLLGPLDLRTLTWMIQCLFLAAFVPKR